MPLPYLYATCMKRTDEHNAKIGQALRGRSKSDEHRARLRQAQRARRALEEATQPAEWSPERSRRAVINAVRSGRMERPAACTRDDSHAGPYEWDHHHPTDPYAWENRYVVQSLCRPCHVAVSTERRAGRGYTRKASA